MSQLSLTRRRTQLELLSAVCAAHQRAQYVIADSFGSAAARNTRFLALESDSLLLEWPISGTDDLLTPGTLISITFEYEDEPYTFTVRSLERVWWDSPERGATAAWKLAVPLRLESRQRRAYGRVSLSDLAPIPVRFTSTADPQATFVGRLINLSTGGFGAVAPADEDPDVGVGDLHWAAFELPDGNGPCEFVVRCVHANTLEPSGTTVLGCALCPADDGDTHRSQVERIERFVHARHSARQQRGHTSPVGGV